MTHKRIRQYDENGNALSEVTIREDTLAGFTAEQMDRVEVLDDENPFDRHHRPRGPEFPNAATGSAEPNAYTGTNADLEAEIARRNDGRTYDEQIVVDPPGNKAELVAALVADDERHA